MDRFAAPGGCCCDSWRYGEWCRGGVEAGVRMDVLDVVAVGEALVIMMLGRDGGIAVSLDWPMVILERQIVGIERGRRGDRRRISNRKSIDD